MNVRVCIMVCFCMMITSARAQLSVALRDMNSVAGVDMAIQRLQAEAANETVQQRGLETEGHRLRERMIALERRLRDRTRALYRIRRAGIGPLAGGFDALLTHFARVERLERMVRRGIHTLRDVREARQKNTNAAIEAARRLENYRVEQVRLQERRKEVQRMQEDAWLYQQAFDSLDAFDSSQVTSSVSASVGSTVSSSAVGSMQGMEGHLSMPVGGTFRAQDATREGGVGVELIASSFAAVRASAAGRVVFAQAYSVYGTMVILDHGGGYYTVYAGLGSVGVQKDEWLSQGTMLGRLPSRETPALFFQVRQGTRNLNARGWLGL